MTREDCREQVDGYSCAKYKKLRTIGEAEAWVFGGASQSGPIEQRSDPYPVRPKTKSANHSHDQASAGPSNDTSDAAAEPSRVTASFLSAPVEDVVYTDGACSGNGQYGSVAGIGVWWGSYDTRYALSLQSRYSLIPASIVETSPNAALADRRTTVPS